MRQGVSEPEISENHQRFTQRTALLKRYGYDSVEANAFVFRQLPRVAGKILDIGSGKGRFLLELLARGYVVTSVDIDHTEQRFARLNVAYEGLGERVRFLQADATCLPFGDAGFGTIVSVNALHHFTDWKPLLSELLRVVDPRGTLLLADFNETGYAVLDRVYASEGKVHDRTVYKGEEIADVLEKRGWRVRTAEADCQWALVARQLPF